MSKPLSNDKKDEIFENIIKSLSYIHRPAPGEFSINMLKESLDALGYEISRHKIRHRLDTLVEAEILGRREISIGGSRTGFFSPIRDASYEEILEVLLD